MQNEIGHRFDVDPETLRGLGGALEIKLRMHLVFCLALHRIGLAHRLHSLGHPSGALSFVVALSS